MGVESGVQSAEQVIGIDLGGTAIKLGRFDRTGQCLEFLTIATPQAASPSIILKAMVEAIAQLDPGNYCRAIGVGLPGPTDATGRVSQIAINIPGWQAIPLAEWLEQETGKPTILANDANCAGLGEYWLGAGRAFRHLFLLTLGTGVGGAVILDGKLFTGHRGNGAELGFITLNPDGPTCNSGNRGSLEQYLAVPAIRRRTGLEPDELGRRAQAGDPEAIAFWQSYGRDLGAGLAGLIYIFTPEAVLIGGGVSASAAYFFPTAWAEIERRVMPSSREGLQLLPAQLGNQAGIVGAAKLAWQLLESAPPAPRFAEVGDLPLQQQLQQTQLAHRMAVELGQFKAGFLARTSHELRSPMNTIISLHQLILSDLCDSPQEERDFIAQAQTAAKKMLDLLDDLINVAKVDGGWIEMRLETVDLEELLQEVYMMTYLKAQNRNLKLLIDFPNVPIQVQADVRWLRQVLCNLIDTSINLMQEGQIRLTTQVDNDTKFVQIRIADQRPLETWWEPIDLLTTASTTPLSESLDADAKEIWAIAQSISDHPSSGLSLLINQALVQLMQGRLELIAVPATVIERLPNPATIPYTENTTCIQCSMPLS
jgi:glucokinase